MENVHPIGTALTQKHFAETAQEQADLLHLDDATAMDYAQKMVCECLVEIQGPDVTPEEETVMLMNYYRVFVAAKAIIAIMMKNKEEENG